MCDCYVKYIMLVGKCLKNVILVFEYVYRREIDLRNGSSTKSSK